MNASFKFTCMFSCMLILIQLGRTKKVIKVEKISEKYDILTVEEKLIPFIGKNTKRRLEMTPRQIELESRRLKV